MTAKKHTKTTPRESSQRRQLSESGLSLTELAKSGLTREEAKRLAMHPQPRTPEEREELRRRRAAAPAADARTTAGSTTASGAGTASSARPGTASERRTAPDLAASAERGGGR